jgi:hypothetical protein
MLHLTLDGDNGAGSVGGSFVGNLAGLKIHLQLTGDMTIAHEAHGQTLAGELWPGQREAEELQDSSARSSIAATAITQHEDSGPSREWKAAHDRAAPEPGAQTTLVSILSRPILSTDTAAQARRVADLRRLIDGLDPATAERLDARLVSTSDALGELFRLTLHHVTRQELLARLDRVRHALPAAAPTSAATPSGVTPPSAPASSSAPASPSTGPAQPPPTGPGSQTTDPPPPTIVDPGPLWSVHIRDLQGPPRSTDHDTWVSDLLRQAERALGVQASAAMSLLPTWVIGVAIDAAADVIAGAAGARLDVTFGHVGERAAEAILREASGSPVVNLDDLLGTNNFPAADLISRLGAWQVKFFGCAGKDLSENDMLSRYLGELFDLFTGWGATDRAAKLLLDNRDRIAGQGAWPSGLRARSGEGVASWLRDNIGLLVPSDALPVLVSDRGRAYLADRIRRSGASMISRLDVGTPAKLNRFVDAQLKRVGSFGIDCQDVRLLIEAASHTFI